MINNDHITYRGLLVFSFNVSSNSFIICYFVMIIQYCYDWPFFSKFCWRLEVQETSDFESFYPETSSFWIFLTGNIIFLNTFNGKPCILPFIPDMRTALMAALCWCVSLFAIQIWCTKMPFKRWQRCVNGQNVSSNWST